MPKDKKIKKEKKFIVRRFVKELKRVRWSSNRKNWVSFWQIVIFTLIFVLAVFALATLFTLLWTTLKVN
ncbi:preprotein translocase subunit SecE [Mycoplasmopsis gallinarum]